MFSDLMVQKRPGWRANLRLGHPNRAIFFLFGSHWAQLVLMPGIFYHVITGCEGYITFILSCLHYPVIQEMSVSWRWTPMATMWESSTHPDSKWVHFWLLTSIRLSLFRKWSKPSLNSCRWTVPHIGFWWFQN